MNPHNRSPHIEGESLNETGRMFRLVIMSAAERHKTEGLPSRPHEYGRGKLNEVHRRAATVGQLFCHVTLMTFGMVGLTSYSFGASSLAASVSPRSCAPFATAMGSYRNGRHTPP